MPHVPPDDDTDPAREFPRMARESAQQIWLAGLGAFAKAQAEGGKVFEALVREGMALQRKTQDTAQEHWGEAAQRMGQMASGLGERAPASGTGWRASSRSACPKPCSASAYPPRRKCRPCTSASTPSRRNCKRCRSAKPTATA